MLLILLKISAVDAHQLEKAVSICSAHHPWGLHSGDFLKTPDDVSWAHKPNPVFQYNHQTREKTNCCKIIFEKGSSVIINCK